MVSADPIGRFGPYELRTATGDDLSFLRQMLHAALFVEPGQPRPPESVLDEPELLRYIDGFGSWPGDAGVVALLEGQPVGAAWSRVFPHDRPGFGWVDDGIPELSVAVVDEHRSRGLGTRLVETVMRLAGDAEHEVISLSVDPGSPAVRLYERLGFEHVGWEGTSITMVGSTSGG